MCVINIINECRDRLNDSRCVQHGTYTTTYWTRHKIVHELRLWALQKNDRINFEIEFRGAKSTTRTSGFGSNDLTWWMQPKYPPFQYTCLKRHEIKVVKLNLNQLYLQKVDSIPAYNPRRPCFRTTCDSTSIGPLKVLVLSWSLDEHLAIRKETK